MLSEEWIFCEGDRRHELCRLTCGGLCYRCIEHRWQRLAEDLNEEACNCGTRTPSTALKIAALVYQDVCQRFIEDNFYKPNEREMKAFEAIKDVTEADPSACLKCRDKSIRDPGFFHGNGG
jgi:hypothetical protein